MITREDYLRRFHELAAQEVALTDRKNADYTGSEAQDALRNFRLIEYMTNGIIPAEYGLLVRMSDKLARIAILIAESREAKVNDESLLDSLRDLAVYSKITEILLEDNKREEAAAEEEMMEEDLSHSVENFQPEYPKSQVGDTITVVPPNLNNTPTLPKTNIVSIFRNTILGNK